MTDVELSYDRVLEITIWEPHRNTNEFVGSIRLGPKPQPGNKNKWMDSVGSEFSQWEMMMMARTKEWIDQWHPLRLLNNLKSLKFLSQHTPSYVFSYNKSSSLMMYLLQKYLRS